MALGRFYHIAGLDAAGADIDFLYLAFMQGPYPLKVGVEPAFGHIVCMADIVSNHGFLSA